MEVPIERSPSLIPTEKGLNGGLDMGFYELFEKCSKMCKYQPINRGASNSRLGGGRIFNNLQKTKYTPLYISLPSIGFCRRGNI